MKHIDIATIERIDAINALREVWAHYEEMDDRTLYNILQYDLNPQNLIAEADAANDGSTFNDAWTKQVILLADLVDVAVELLEELGEDAGDADGAEAMLMLRLEQITELWDTCFSQESCIAA